MSDNDVQLLVFVALTAIAFVGSAVALAELTKREVTAFPAQEADLQSELTECKLELLQAQQRTEP